MAARREPFACIATIPVLRIAALKTALAYYRDWLGFNVDWLNQTSATQPAYLQVSRDGCVLHLSQFEGDATGATAFFRARGVRALREELMGRNGYSAPSLQRTFHRSVQLKLMDPFGNRIRFDEDDEDWIDPARVAGAGTHHDDTD